jgi:lysozyme family protein
MPAVEQMIDDILRREGGFSDHPNDRGGPTKYGITIHTLSRYLGRPAQRHEVQSLSVEIARDIYERIYYINPRLDKLPESIQPFIFDSAVNHGPQQAIRFIQSVCNQAGYLPPLAVDGIMGPNTLKGVEWAEQEMGDLFYKALIEERRNFYYTIVKFRPSQKVFLKGWLNRIKEFEKEAA